jgi:hypothetical protein
MASVILEIVSLLAEVPQISAGCSWSSQPVNLDSCSEIARVALK